uniref:Uncharacterized protein n=1 Tax=Macrostomum lignano TaxID=282301 RepID=A0A1I8HU31_9PLAT
MASNSQQQEDDAIQTVEKGLGKTKKPQEQDVTLPEEEQLSSKTANYGALEEGQSEQHPQLQQLPQQEIWEVGHLQPQQPPQQENRNTDGLLREILTRLEELQQQSTRIIWDVDSVQQNQAQLAVKIDQLQDQQKRQGHIVSAASSNLEKIGQKMAELSVSVKELQQQHRNESDEQQNQFNKLQEQLIEIKDAMQQLQSQSDSNSVLLQQEQQEGRQDPNRLLLEEVFNIYSTVI